MPLDDEVLDIEQVAKLLKVTSRTARRWVVDGRIRGRKIGKSWRVLKSEVFRALSEAPEK